MPAGAAIAYFGVFLGEQRFEERQLMQADDDGMIERFVALEGVKQPRMLSWAELRALRHDRAAWAEFVWPQYATVQDWQKDLLSKMDSEEWRRQYLCNWEPPKVCKCPPYLGKVFHATGKERLFTCGDCGGYKEMDEPLERRQRYVRPFWRGEL